MNDLDRTARTAAAIGSAVFQRRFARALLARGPATDAFACQPGFAVYRNTVMIGCIDALQALYPTIARLMGAPWFRGAAAEYVYRRPPDDGPLLLYGDRFADFLAAFGPARAFEYLPAVAGLDRLWSECHAAANAPVLDAGHLLRRGDALRTLRLHPHPAARWCWSRGVPAYTIWSRTRAGVDPGRDLIWRSEGALLTRPTADVRWQRAGPAACALLDACAAAQALPEALAQALQAEADVDPGALLAGLTRAGALVG